MSNLPRSGPCGCKRGLERDNCPQCEGSGMAIDWGEYHRQRRVSLFKARVAKTLESYESVSVVSEESHFSWSPCDMCGSRLGGDREDAVGTLKESLGQDELAICGDCTMYVANGDEPYDWSEK